MTTVTSFACIAVRRAHGLARGVLRWAGYARIAPKLRRFQLPSHHESEYGSVRLAYIKCRRTCQLGNGAPREREAQHWDVRTKWPACSHPAGQAWRTQV